MLVEKQNSLQLRESALLQWLQEETDFHVDKLEMVSGDASFRRYFRFSTDNSPERAEDNCLEHTEGNSLEQAVNKTSLCEGEKTSYIAVDAPPEKESNHEFYHVARSYKDAGVKVPEVVKVDLTKGFWVLEDFGDDLLSHHYDSKSIEALYSEALGALKAIQSVTDTEQGRLPVFDDALLDAEFHLFNHWLLEVHLNLELEETEKQLLHNAQAFIRKVFKEQPQAGVHRDYHSRNLMVLNSANSAPGQIGIIDFQDAVIGPVTYDAVSLLRDCYVVWPEDMIERLLLQWSEKMGFSDDIEQLRYWFDFVGMQRHIKASGIFCRLCYRDGKSLYLNDIPRTLGYLVDIAAQYPQTRAFSQLISEKILPAVLARKAA